MLVEEVSDSKSRLEALDEVAEIIVLVEGTSGDADLDRSLRKRIQNFLVNALLDNYFFSDDDCHRVSLEGRLDSLTVAVERL